MDNQKQIRNFVIISHIDHGKSTLADRFLELTGTVSKEKMRTQFLDTMDLEREKGITIKMQPVRMTYCLNSNTYYLNLIDTPGHVDFSYEVSRSLAAVEGAILLVDATKGIQAQTLANLELAQKQGLVIIPAINKIDLPHAQIEKTSQELAQVLGIKEGEEIRISAKQGTNVEKLLNLIIERVPSPEGKLERPFRALIFDSEYNPYKGVIAYVRVFDGEIKPNEKIKLLADKTKGEAKEIGYFIPELSSQSRLSAGEIGYIATSIKEADKVRVGDTIVKADDQFSSFLPGYQEPRPMVFASLYPENHNDFGSLKEALGKLKLNDPSLIYEPETKEFLGRGFRCGFLGTLHIEIVLERLRREFDLNLIITAPSVVYKIIDNKNKEKIIYSASQWPKDGIKQIKEPWVYLEVITPIKYIGPLLEILETFRGNYIETKYLNVERAILVYQLPLQEVIINLYDKIKNLSQGFGSMNYKFIGYKPADLVKIEILIAGEKQEAFSKIVHRSRVEKEARALVQKIKELLPSQQFSVPIQAAVNGKIIARETKRALRKDVTAPLYGGDYTRKRKLLEKQKKGKKKLAGKSQVRIPPKVFLDIFSS